MGAHTTQKLRKISSHKYRRQVKLQAAHRNSTFQSQQSILENKKTILFQTSQQQSKNPMLPGTNQTYGCPIWYNMSASLMEKIRRFERKCIRACLSTYRSEHSGFIKYGKNKGIYDLANIHRIDCHILKLTRNFAQAAKIKENSSIFNCLFPNDSYYKNTLTTGYIPPKLFYT